MLVDEPDFDVRYTEAADGASMRRWLLDPKVAREFPLSGEQELEAFLPNWLGFYRFKCSLTATYKDSVIGVGTLLLMPYKKLVHHCLSYLVVDPAYQRQGVGTALMRNLKHLAKDYFKFESVYSEYYDGSPIEGLLKKQGFEEVLRQEKFVKDKDGYRARVLMEARL